MVSANLSILCDELMFGHGRQNLLSTYVQFQCKIPHPLHTVDEKNGHTEQYLMSESYSGRDGQVRLLHEELAFHWVAASGKAAEMAMSNSWFLFELIIKSMIEHLQYTHSLNGPRKGRFPHQFTDDLLTLVHLVATKVVGYHTNSNNPKFAESLNASLGFFIFDLFSVMDRGFVFTLVKNHFKVLISKNTAIPDLMTYKIDFLRIVCSHEHFFALNLPFGTAYTISSAPTSPTPSITSNNSQNSFASNMVKIISNSQKNKFN